MELTRDTVCPYLRDRGVVTEFGDVDVELLGGGVSNVVLRVSVDGDAVVVKQPLPNLAVEDDWPADVERVHNEAAAIRVYERVIEEVGLGPVTVPAVRFESHDDHVIATACAPSGAEMWKAELLAGTVDPAVATLLGRCLGHVHATTAADEGVRSAFDHDRPFEQLRLDPYHWTVARRHPDVASPVRDEIERLEGAGRTLVHGDYSPKNVLVDRSGDEPAIWILDFEVAHWGDPAFDAAFMLNHLYLKSVYRRPQTPPYLAAARRFWSAYERCVDWSIEEAVVRELGVLQLARVDGKSPVEYVDRETTADAIRRIGKRTLTESVASIDAFEEIVIDEVRALPVEPDADD